MNRTAKENRYTEVAARARGAVGERGRPRQKNGDTMPPEHPLTEQEAATLRDSAPDGATWEDLTPEERTAALLDMRAGWDARASLAATEVTPEAVGRATDAYVSRDPGNEVSVEDDRMRAALEAVIPTVAEAQEAPAKVPLDWAVYPADPGDTLEWAHTVDGVHSVRTAVFDHMNEEGDPCTPDGTVIGASRVGTWKVARKPLDPLAGPHTFGKIISEVLFEDGSRCDALLWDGSRWSNYGTEVDPSIIVEFVSPQDARRYTKTDGAWSVTPLNPRRRNR